MYYSNIIHYHFNHKKSSFAKMFLKPIWWQKKMTNQRRATDLPKGVSWEIGSAVEGGTNKVNSILLIINAISLEAVTGKRGY